MIWNSWRFSSQMYLSCLKINGEKNQWQKIITTKHQWSGTIYTTLRCLVVNPKMATYITRHLLWLASVCLVQHTILCLSNKSSSSLLSSSSWFSQLDLHFCNPKCFECLCFQVKTTTTTTEMTSNDQVNIWFDCLGIGFADQFKFIVEKSNQHH